MTQMATRMSKKYNWFNKQKKQLCRCIMLFLTFLSCFCMTRTWKCLILIFALMEDKILSLFLSLDMVPNPWNSASVGFAYIWQSKWVAKIAMTFLVPQARNFFFLAHSKLPCVVMYLYTNHFRCMLTFSFVVAGMLKQATFY